MKNLIPLASSLLVLVSLFLFSCEKEEPTKQELLVGPKWKDVAFYTAVKGRNTGSYYGAYPPCKLDDFRTFKATGTFTYDEGPVICNANPQIRSGYWQLTDNDTKLTFKLDGQSVTDEWTVVEITKSLIKIQQPSPYGGIDYVLEMAPQ